MSNRITIETDESFAPGCFILCQVDKDGNYSTRDESRTKLVQRDTDFPAMARNFGWTGEDDDIEGAVDYLHDTACGDIIEDPGYFTDD
tara:strand:+ start:173796 stop:174059 length:264 start_codon:yes stop_codon:yes gene_type:complete